MGTLIAALVVAAVMLPWSAAGQSLTLTNGAARYGGLSNTVVTMTGRCELWLTNSTAPLSGSTVDLDSPDAWLFLPKTSPSTIASKYLGQIRVNGAKAAAGSNVRISPYAEGSVVIPHAPAFKPLEAYSEPFFMGASAPFGQYVYYTGAKLGAMNQKIRSFRLKRGYMAVFAQDVHGASHSKSYIAQDGDLNIAALPATLDDKIQFIYVTPWRWVAKKGIAGDPGIPRLNVNWDYNWNISGASTADLEYVPIKQNPGWPSLAQNWQSLGANTLLGYNEPDNAGQANTSVGAAISGWPSLLGTGLRTGSPATTDGGRNGWLYPFIQQADAAGLRVDFVAAHYYWAANPSDPNGAAGQMYNFLLDIWNNTHRPIWITEWNNGANWTDNNPYPAPTYAQQRACIAAMISMLESTPFVERYALYNWVEDTRSLVNSSGAVTPAGAAYSNQVSQLSYRQTIPDNGARAIAQYRFEDGALDTSGYGNHGIDVGQPLYSSGPHGPAVELDGVNNYIELPANLGKGAGFSFAARIKWNGGAAWQRIMDFGLDTSHYLFLTPSSGGGTLRFAINNGGGEQFVESTALPASQWRHVCVTLAGNTAKLYVNGVLAASSTQFNTTPSAFAPFYNYLGRSQFPADPLFNGSLSEVEIADYAFSPAQIAALARGAVTTPASLSYSLAGTAMTLSWPSDHTGWRLQRLTGPLASGSGSNWVDLPGASLTNQVTIAISSGSGPVFYRLIYP